MNQQIYSRVEYTKEKYIPQFPDLNNYDIMVIQAFCKVTPCKVVIKPADINNKRKALLIDYEQDFPYLVQKDAEGVFIYSHRTHEKKYINFRVILKELIIKYGQSTTLNLLSRFLANGIVTTQEVNNELTFHFQYEEM